MSITQYSEMQIIHSITKLSTDINCIANEHGFWEGYSFGDKIALIHSELSEALEGDRNGNPPDEHLPQYGSVPVELADAIIRILDLAQQYQYPIAEIILAKMAFNKTRPHKHGKRY